MHTIYENQILENKMTELIDTKLNTRALMTLDTSLAEGAGLRKVINRYTYKGSVENLAKGAKNSVKGTVSFVPEYYDVKRYQQTFEYNDMDAMSDPYIVEVAMKGATNEITNQINKEYFNEISKISRKSYFDGDSVTYADIVDALSLIDVEVDTQLFIIMGSEMRKQIRKDPDFIASKQGEILYTGQFGTLCGIPVLFSKLVSGAKAYITNQEAVRFFVKKEATVEQARDIETKDNTVVYERHGLIALVDDTTSLQIGKNPKELTVSVTENVDTSGEVYMAKAVATKTDSANSIYYSYSLISKPFAGEVLNLSECSTLLPDGSIAQFQKGEKVSFFEVDSSNNIVAYFEYTFQTSY
ncbi:MAG: hypothetical protein IJZ93_04385 [Clostridia bacterium]|nr:hypothetical protein [Clostridia bacterium]